MTDSLHIVCPHCHTTLPTLVLFVNGSEVARQTCATSMADMVRWTQSHL